MKLTNLKLSVAVILFSILSQAHIQMSSPLGRMGTRDDVKFTQATPSNPSATPDSPGPCSTYTTPMANRLQYVAGQTVNFTFAETINHPGRFIVQFSPGNGQGFWNTENQLVNVADTQVRGSRSLPVTMPSAPCDNCMLRVLQQMDDQPREYYVHCFDIKLTAAVPGQPLPPPGNSQPVGTFESGSSGTSETKFGGGCGLISTKSKNGPHDGAAMMLLFFPFLFFLYLRRRSQVCARI